MRQSNASVENQEIKVELGYSVMTGTEYFMSL
jgi:hypothetical protein